MAPQRTDSRLSLPQRTDSRLSLPQRNERRDSSVSRRRDSSLSRRRDSLPSSCDSSTVVTEKNVRLRQAARRQSIAEFKLQAKKQRDLILRKENDPPSNPYSPPMTRSAKKSSQVIGIPRCSNGLVLNFSPPNQEENEAREQLEKERKEAARAMRIRKSRDSGNLLIYSPSGRPLYHPAGVENEIEDQVMTDVSPTKSIPGFHSRVDDELKGLLDEMKEIMKSSTNSNVDAVLQQQFQRMEVLTNEKAKLEFENKDLKDKLSSVSTIEAQLQNERAEKEKLLSDNASCQSQWEQKFRAVEEEKKEIQGAMHDLEKQIAALKTKNADAEERLHQQNTVFEEMKETLAKDNATMRHLVEKIEKEKEAVEQRALQLEQSIQTVSKRASETTQQVESCLEEKEEALVQAKAAQQELENALAALRLELETTSHKAVVDREAFISMNEANQRIQSDLEQSIAEKDKKIGELFKQLGEKHSEVEKERALSSSMAGEVEKLKENLQFETSKAHQAESELEVLQKTMTKCNEELELLSGRQEEMVATNERLEEEKFALEEAVKKLKEVVEQLSARVTDLSAAKELLENEKLALQEELQQSDTSLIEAKNENKKYAELQKVTKTELEQSLLDAITARDEMEQKLADIEKRLASQQQKLSGALGRVEDLECALKNASDEKDMMKNHMATFNEREDELRKKLWHAEGVRRAMHGKLIQLMGNIRVFVRVRPAIQGELGASANTDEETKKVSPGDKRKRSESQLAVAATPFHFPGVFSDASSDDMTKNRIEVTEPPKDRGGLKDRRKTWSFAFDGVFPPESSQKEVWEATEPLVQCAVDGYNVTVFAYGQTGSGKTYTMLGEAKNEGIIARAVGKLFAAKDEIETLSLEETEVKVSVELLEIYNEKVRDLLAPQGSDFLKVTSQDVSGNLVVETSCKEHVLKILQHAQSRRCVKETLSNAESSRSHLIFTIHFDVKGKDGSIRKGKLNICDLAGSERLSKSGAHEQGGALLKETQHINKSLSTLSNVIERLQAGDNNVPFRESKLTLLLKDSLSGNSKTLAIVCCNPLSTHMSESISSLRFASKVNRVDLKAATNFSC
ncbi:hypothetical protein FisN_5Hh229 [Fistulifera solaris]|uniref:Kinesin motor domain-containing protein n=1 Tax=Fistulifera solaris TaxID=1519565 RepID=A0A1Z5JSJ5_FISSO|nr:hypothetical protein FisN_5Hh229 [Fistulifera solaris]|eukprot:GAX16856.1 hypothetical protein FisN_5Hh229 [Fistulifera solaris]